MTKKQIETIKAAIEVIEAQCMTVTLAQIETRDDFKALGQLAMDMADAQDVLLSMIDGRVKRTVEQVRHSESHQAIN